MESGGILGGFHRFSSWIIKITYLNFLWVLFTLAGLVFFGIGSSTIALFTVLRKMTISTDDFKIFQVFKTEFIKNIFAGMKITYFYAGIGILIYFDILYFIQFENIVYTLLVAFLILLMIFFFLAVSYIFPLYSHYEMKTFEYVKNSFLFPLFAPLQSLLLVCALFLCTILFALVPGLLPFIGISLPAYMVHFFVHRSFLILEEKRKKTPLIVDLHD
jgi:uncharacterized membrane protein YesL